MIELHPTLSDADARKPYTKPSVDEVCTLTRIVAGGTKIKGNSPAK